MATEDIRFEDGHLVVERFGTKQNVDVALSDVDSISFVRSADIFAEGALILHLKKGIVLDESGEGASVVQKDVVIRVANDDAGDVLSAIKGASVKKTAPAEKVTASK
jgi:hypothetical protein